MPIKIRRSITDNDKALQTLTSAQEALDKAIDRLNGVNITTAKVVDALGIKPLQDAMAHMNLLKRAILDTDKQIKEVRSMG